MSGPGNRTRNLPTLKSSAPPTELFLLRLMSFQQSHVIINQQQQNMCSAVYDLFIHTCLCSPNRIYYSPHLSYSQSKLANILFTYELDRRLKARNSPVAVNALHPGVVNTDLFQYVHWLVRIPQKLLANVFFMVSTDVFLRYSDCLLCFALWTWLFGPPNHAWASWCSTICKQWTRILCCNWQITALFSLSSGGVC